MNPKKKPRRCRGLGLDSGIDLASLVSPTALNYVKSINQLGDFLCSLFTMRNNIGNGS
jgi:hypothetical protein